MRKLMFTLVGTMCCTVLVNGAHAQRLRQPLSVKPIGFNYNGYQAEVASPSDAPAASVADAINQAEAPEAAAVPHVVGSQVAHDSAAYSTSPSCGCSAASCGSLPCGGCDSCCGSSCGGGSLLGGGCLGSLLGDSCNSCGPFDLGEHLFGADSDWDLGGWTQFGYHSANDGVFNTHPGTLDLQQGYLYLEKTADGSNGFGWGGRVDVVYGTDGSNTQSFGNNPGRFDFQNGFDYGIYGWAIPQLYGEVAYQDLSVKIGHFYTLLGYQVVPATGNFFYSIPYTFNFSEAFTHTGALATYSGYEDVTLYGGWTLGWDTGFDQLNQGNSFLGGASLNLTDDLTATYICTFGNLGWIGDNAYTHSFVADWNINDSWEYVFQSDLNSIDNSPNAGGGHYDTIGINQYLFYTVNEKVRASARLEWWKADGISVNETAFGFNVKPHDNVLFRPELRYNWVPGGTLPAVIPVAGPLNATATADYINNAIFGVDMILTF